MGLPSGRRLDLAAMLGAGYDTYRDGTRSGVCDLACLPDPGLGTHLDRFPGTAEGRGIGQVEVADGIDGHTVKDGGRGDVDPLGDLGVAVAEELDAEQPPGTAVAGEPHPDPVAA